MKNKKHDFEKLRFQAIIYKNNEDLYIENLKKQYKNHKYQKELNDFETRNALLLSIGIILVFVGLHFDFLLIAIVGVFSALYAGISFMIEGMRLLGYYYKESLGNIGKECKSDCKYCKNEK